MATHAEIRMQINGRLVDGCDEVDCVLNWLVAIGYPRDPHYRRVAVHIVKGRYKTLREARRVVTQK